jgi:hypothetical protein
MHVAVCIAVLSAVSQTAGADVTVTGGTTDGQLYEWTVKNRLGVGIQAVEFPYYDADQLNPPDGWTAEASTGLIGQYGGGAGIATFTASMPRFAIRPRESRSFSLRVAPSGAYRGTGDVTVVLVDGTRRTIAGVPCPQQEPWFRRNFPAVGLGATFVLFVLIAQIARRRRTLPASDGDGADTDGPAAANDA